MNATRVIWMVLLAAAAAAASNAQSTYYVHFEHRISDISQVFEDLSDQVSVDFQTASAREGQLSVSTSMARTTDPNGTSRGESEVSHIVAGFKLLRTALDPEEAGVLGVVRYQTSGDATPAGKAADMTVTVPEGNIPGRSCALFTGVDATHTVRDCSCLNGSLAHSGEVPIAASFHPFQMEISLFGGAMWARGPSSVSASAGLTYTVSFIEDRMHWNTEFGGGVGEMEFGNETQWIELIEPKATQYAVFNREEPRTIAMALDRDRAWRGLIVDGESISLALAGHTVGLGSEGPSQKSFNLSVGEGRRTPSALTFKNGVVKFDKDIYVGNSPFAPGTLTIEEGLLLTNSLAADSSSLVVGKLANGTLNVRGGSIVFTDGFVLGAETSSEQAAAIRIIGAADISGAGSKVKTTLTSIGAKGEGAVNVRAGGILETEVLTLGDQTNSFGSLIVDGAGSQLKLKSGFVSIGRLGEGSLEIKNGAVIEGDGSKLGVGSKDISRFSVLRLIGNGSLMADTGVNVNGGGLFEVRDGASWSNAKVNVFSMSGGEARFENATVHLLDAAIGGQFDGPSLVASGNLHVLSGANLIVESELFVSGGGRIEVNGTGARLSGFQNLKIEGALSVGNGGEVFGQLIGMGSAGRLEGNRGLIHANIVTANGELYPGNSPGVMTIDGSVDLSEAARLVLEIGGTTAEEQYDVLNVTGDLALHGVEVELRFVHGFSPRANDVFRVLNVAGNLSGASNFRVTGLQPGWQFNPIATGGQLTVTAINNGVVLPAEIAIEQPVGEVVLSGSVRSFGELALNESADLVFTIKNSGEGDLAQIVASIAGADAAAFTIVTPPSPVIQSGKATQLMVRFSPASVGSKSAALRVQSNDADEGDVQIQLSGSAFNRPPVATLDFFERSTSTRVVEIPFATLLANDTDAENNPLTVTQVADANPPGATVTIAGKRVIYTAPAYFAGSGGFTYTLSDGPGGNTASGTVEIAQVDGPSPKARAVLEDGGVTLHFVGEEGRKYRVQHAETLTDQTQWFEFDPPVIYTAPSTGDFEHHDSTVSDNARFYRIVEVVSSGGE